MKLTCDEFQHNEMIPQKYTCLGDNINPPLNIANIPEGTESLVLIVDDPDATKGTFTHWLLYDIPSESQIMENSIPGMEGSNSQGKNEYTGPCPPSGIHHYHFKLYALDALLKLPEGQTKAQIEEAIQGHVLAEDELIGLFTKEVKQKVAR